ncbi:MAG: hypothetical protein PHV30_07485 [Candidatus Margulisbacteria bacterium]|nr:hypothetical protein [Candidatus Margulisiibacteriota bacterium]
MKIIALKEKSTFDINKKINEALNLQSLQNPITQYADILTCMN